MDLRERINHSRILIVDDQQANVSLLEKMLNRNGFSDIRTLTDSRQAVDTFKEYQPDLLLLDLNMPHMDGFAVMRELKNVENSGYLSILVLTAQADRETRLQALESGAKDFLGKPFDQLEIMTRIRNLLEVRLLYNEIKDQNVLLDDRVRERTQELEAEIAFRTRAEARIIFHAFHSRLTGLPNLVYLREHLWDDIESPDDDDRKLAFLVIRLKRYYEVVNTLGNYNADQLLKKIVQRLRVTLASIPQAVCIEETEHRREHLIHLDRGEYVALINIEESATDLFGITRSIVQALEDPVDYQGMSIDIYGTIGIAFMPQHGRDIDTLLRYAHVAADAAERTGDDIIIYSNDIDPYSSRRLSLMTELRKAIDQDELELYFQPQVDLSTGKTIGAEALVRWNHAEHGFIPPDEFIPIAEQTGVIKPLTKWVLGKAVEFLADIEAQGFSIDVSVNLSANNLRDTDLAQDILNLISRYKVTPDQIMLEITESAMMTDPEYSLNVLNAYSSLGLQISIDDFGTGYSSLAYLKRLPAHELKIDRAFVMDMINDKDDAMIVRTTVEMGHNLGLTVVAEGVENEETLLRLQQMGCDNAQGYFIGKPMPSKTFMEWLINTEWQATPITTPDSFDSAQL